MPAATRCGLPLTVAEVVQVEVATALGREEQRVVRVRRLALERVESDRLRRTARRLASVFVISYRQGEKIKARPLTTMLKQIVANNAHAAGGSSKSPARSRSPTADRVVV
jgi:hypothetical protein